MLRRTLLALLASTLAACGATSAGGSGDGRPVVVATTTQLADLARNVAGDRATVHGLLAANADPHEHEVRPSDIEGLTGAAVVLKSGGDLDAWLGEALEAAGGDPAVVEMLGAVRTVQGSGHAGEEGHAAEQGAEEGHADEKGHGDEEEHPAEEGDEGEAGHAEEGADPHWWHDPRNAEVAVGRIRDALAKADPAGAATYRANAAAYTRKLRALDRAVAACLARVPAERRKLVTTHDALGYYARRYGIEVIGAVIPSLSTRGQPSAGETQALVETIRRERIRAIFAESSVSPKIESAIARESGARIGKPLYADTLGPKGSEGATYLGSIAANTRALVDGFTDGSGSCSLPPA